MVAALLVLGFALSLALRVGGASTARVVSDVSLTTGPLLAALSCALRALRNRGRIRASWGLIAGGALAWGLGEAVSAWYELVLHADVPLPSISDIGYLGMPVLTAAGLLTVPLASQSMANRARSVMDGLMVACALLGISFMLLLGQLISQGADNSLGLVVSLAYPVSDVVIVTIVLFILARDRHRHSAQMPLMLVGAGIVTFAVSDTGFAYLSMTGAYDSGSTIDAGWFAGFILIALAARKPTRVLSNVDADAGIGRPLGIMAPYIVVVGAVVVSVVDAIRGAHWSPFVAWDRSILILLMVGRQLLTLLENRELLRTLEARVVERTAELRASEQRFQALVQHSSDVVTVIDVDTVVIYQSESIHRVFGHDSSELVGRALLERFDPSDAQRLREAINSVVPRRYGSVTLEVPFQHADGHVCQAEMTITNLLEDPNVRALVLNTRDITERKTLETQLVHEAFHDSLTGLANRALFTDRVQQELRRTDRDGGLAVLFLDLDGFKEINDSRGHAIGDEVLIEVASRLRDSVRAEDTVARFGGDEFAVLITAMAGAAADAERAEDVACRVLESMRAPISVDGSDLHVTASIGIAHSGPDAEDAGQIMRNADLAMYRTKAAGVHGYTLYHPDMHSELVGRLALAADMRRGLSNGEFQIFFQPTIDMVGGHILGFEALARWVHPERGFIPPVEFIPLAETTGLICQLGTWILVEAARQAQEWTEREQRPISVSVNVSARQLEQSDFIEIVRDALEQSGLAPHQLCLEMTESVLLEDSDAVLDVLNALKEVGVQLAIDDFGTGYSSLSYLNRFPFDTLKIDKSFIDRLTTASDETTLARTIVQLGQGLGVRTVAEGLEHFDQFIALRRMGCDVGQGYYFSKPVPAASAGELLASDAATSWSNGLAIGSHPDGLSA